MLLKVYQVIYLKSSMDAIITLLQRNSDLRNGYVKHVEVNFLMVNYAEEGA